MKTGETAGMFPAFAQGLSIKKSLQSIFRQKAGIGRWEHGLFVHFSTVARFPGVQVMPHDGLPRLFQTTVFDTG